MQLFLVLLSFSGAFGYSFQELSFSNEDVSDGISIYGEFACAVEGTTSFSSADEAVIFRLNQTTAPSVDSWQPFTRLNGTVDYDTHVSLSSTNLFVSGTYNNAFLYEINDTSTAWDQIYDLELPSQVSSAVVGDKYLVTGDGSNCHDKGSFTGCVYVSRKETTQFANGTVWKRFEHLNKVYASDADGYEHFGEFIDMWEDKYFIVGASMTNNFDKNGGAYIFEIIEDENGQTVQIIEVAALKPTDADVDYFGSGVAIFNNYAAVVAHGYTNDDYWSVYFYERDDTTGNWTETTRFIGPNLIYRFGSNNPTVALFNNYCVIGNPQYNNSEGEVFILHRSPATGTWEQVQHITNETDPSAQKFGQSVDVFENHAIVSAEDKVYMISDFKPDDISSAPTILPTNRPSENPTIKPSNNPTEYPTIKPTADPSQQPSLQPTAQPTDATTDSPTFDPSQQASTRPTLTPTNVANDVAEAAGSEEENFICDEDTSKKLVIVVLACVVCVLLCTNVGIVTYFRFFSGKSCRRKDEKKHKMVPRHPEALQPKKVQVAIAASVAQVENVTNLKNDGKSSDIALTRVTTQPGLRGTEGHMTLGGDNEESNIDELYVMMTKNGDDHIEQMIGVVEDDEEDEYGLTPRHPTAKGVSGGSGVSGVSGVPSVTNGGRSAGEQSVTVGGHATTTKGKVTLDEGK